MVLLIAFIQVWLELWSLLFGQLQLVIT